MITETIANNKLKEARLKKHLSLRKLADLSGISYVTLWNAEAGKSKIHDFNKQKVVDALNNLSNPEDDLLTRESIFLS